MSKQVIFSSWVSQIPTKMFNKWVSKKWVSPSTHHIGYTSISDIPGPRFRLSKDNECKWIPSRSMVRRMVHQGWKDDKHKIELVKEKIYDEMRDEVGKWYDKVFKYITDWLTKNGYIKLKRGTFTGGFCAETDPDHEVVKRWGAPLADKGNKVGQIKEKFGFYTVYLDNLSPQEEKEIKKFAKQVEKKFDCLTRFN